jgi:hypothetical protein
MPETSVLPFADPSLIFAGANALAMASWLALAASPFRAAWSRRARQVAGLFVPLLLACVYVFLFAKTGMRDGGFDSLAAVQRLFAVPELLTAGWLHFLAFDLFVGAWISERAGEIGVPHLIVLPLLALTFMFGPAGLLAFALVRAVWLRRTPVTVRA